MGMSRSYLLFLQWNYFSIQICRKQSCFKTPNGSKLTVNIINVVLIDKEQELECKALTIKKENGLRTVHKPSPQS